MKAIKSFQLMEKYAKCFDCGNCYIGNGEGTLVVDGTLKRTCKCGWSIEVDENDMEVAK